MSNKIDVKTTKPAGPGPTMNKPDTVYQARQEKERLRKATPAAGGLKEPAVEASAEEPPPVIKSSPPLAPLAALWPGSVEEGGKSKTYEPPVPPKAPVVAAASKASTVASPMSPRPSSIRATPPKSQEESPVRTQAPKPNVTKMVSVSFALRKPDAKQVLLSGEFNGWSANATPMKRHGDGQWETTVALSPGQYQYKFIVDGEWLVDPTAQKNVPNVHGSLNSVLEVRT